MKKAIIGKKVGMTQIFDANGKVIPVTVIEAGPCVVVQKKTVEKDGYSAVQLGFQDELERKLTKPEVGHLKKADVEFQYPVEWGADLQTEHERYLSETAFKKPVFVTDYPKEIKSFYMKQNADGKTVAATDLLAPGVGEIIGGSEREANLDKLLAAMKERNMTTAEYEQYIDLRRFGSVPHGGFGLGFERLIMYVTGIDNIRDVILFPRVVNKIF